MLNHFARFAPRRAAKGEKRVERILRENTSPLKLWRAEMSQLFQNRKIENVLTDRDAYAWFTLCRLKDAEWKILDRKMGVARNVNEGFEGHCNCSGALRASHYFRPTVIDRRYNKFKLRILARSLAEWHFDAKGAARSLRLVGRTGSIQPLGMHKLSINNEQSVKLRA